MQFNQLLNETGTWLVETVPYSFKVGVRHVIRSGSTWPTQENIKLGVSKAFLIPFTLIYRAHAQAVRLFYHLISQPLDAISKNLPKDAYLKQLAISAFKMLLSAIFLSKVLFYTFPVIFILTALSVVPYLISALVVGPIVASLNQDSMNAQPPEENSPSLQNRFFSWLDQKLDENGLPSSEIIHENSILMISTLFVKVTALPMENSRLNFTYQSGRLGAFVLRGEAIRLAVKEMQRMPSDAAEQREAIYQKGLECFDSFCSLYNDCYDENFAENERVFIYLLRASLRLPLDPPPRPKPLQTVITETVGGIVEGIAGYFTLGKRPLVRITEEDADGPEADLPLRNSPSPIRR